jgi:hypothetical protein
VAKYTVAKYTVAKYTVAKYTVTKYTVTVRWGGSPPFRFASLPQPVHPPTFIVSFIVLSIIIYIMLFKTIKIVI